MKSSLRPTRPIPAFRALPTRSVRAKTRRVRLGLEGFENRITPTLTYTITTAAYNNDGSKLAFDGDGNAYNTDHSPLSFEQALGAINTFDLNNGVFFHPGPSVINFNIPGAGVHRIETHGYKTFGFGQDDTTLDGFSQPGAKPNTAPLGSPINAKILIEFDIRCELTCSNNTVRGMSLRGIDLAGNTFFSRDSLNNHIEGNFLGVHADGKTSWGDAQEGVYIGKGAPSTWVGGGLPSLVNLVAGHTGIDPQFGSVANGIFIDGSHNNVIVGNYIGTDKTGSHHAGNTLNGIRIASSPADHNLINENIIGFNGEYGVRVDNGFDNSFTTNSMFSNDKGGIFLAAGTNNDAPAPVLTSLDGSTVTGSLAGASAANPYTVEFFTSTGKDAAGTYEGKKSLLLVQVTSDPFTVDVPGATGFITATATDANDNTSVFSNALNAGAPVGDVKLGVDPNIPTSLLQGNRPGLKCASRMTALTIFPPPLARS
ncbi:MAG TPA: right-handed parallel beta-helix repeat-containing protein [Gemmataceae bacterium]|jgi:hypothetical protein|nr:right-handed parallel beta-helix repeat-containing protein [Gemmataceae bacterium]